MSGPFCLPWLTFAAILVILASVVAAALWAIAAGRGRAGEDDGE